VGVFFSVLFYSITGPTKTSDNSSTNIWINTELKQYDGKTYTVSSDWDKIQWTALLKYQESKTHSYLSVYYILSINDALSSNGKCCESENPQDMGCTKKYNYEYANKLIEEVDGGNGALMVSYCNQWVLPEVGVDHTDIWNRDKCNSSTDDGPYKWFHAQFSETFDNIEEFLAENTFQVYDASNFCTVYEKTENSFSRSLDDDTAANKWDLVAEYIFNVSG